MSGMSDMPGHVGRSNSTACEHRHGGHGGLGHDRSELEVHGDRRWPQSEIDQLTKVSDLQDQGHSMQTPDCSQAPTPVQTLDAMQYVQATSAAVAKYQNLDAAKADGYFAITSTAIPSSTTSIRSTCRTRHPRPRPRRLARVRDDAERSRARGRDVPDAAPERGRPDAVRLSRPMARAHEPVLVDHDASDRWVGAVPRAAPHRLRRRP